MKLRLQAHIECIYFCKWISVGSSIAFIAAFSLESDIEKDNNQAIKRSKYVFNKALRACKLNQAHNQGGGKPGICIRPKVFKHLLDFIEKLMLIFGFSESP